MKWHYNDGGRKAAGFKDTRSSRDCVCRAIATATQTPYLEVYSILNTYALRERTGKRKKGKSNANTGVYAQTIRRVMREHFGWQWVPIMGIGTGCTTHLRDGEVPSEGRYLLSLSRHITALIDGVVHDTYDPSREGKRCVYGYWQEARVTK